MSYCRWSTDCDVYVYEGGMSGFMVHVAASRYVFKDPLPDPVLYTKRNFKEWFAWHERVREMTNVAALETIDLPHDGETFNEPTPAACADRLEQLKALGYRVPQYAIDALREDIE